MWLATLAAFSLFLGAPATAGDVEAADPAGQPDPLFDDDAHDPLFDDDFELVEAESVPDPFEPVNRGMLGFNRFLDRWFFDPITKGYRFILPTTARRAIYRIFLNLEAPPILANDILQLEWRDAGRTLGRFSLNTTFGLGGIFDAAERLGIESHESDFGQTLALAGVETGPYVVVPILGPSTVRDAVGAGVDVMLNPTTYFLGLFTIQQLVYTGGGGISTRDAYYEEIKALEESAVDYYAALRSAYSQNRQSEVWLRRESRRNDWKAPY